MGELSENNQARLLRALQERTIVRLGSTAPVPVDVRVVAATNRDLLADIARGRFREDLYFRLNGATVLLPPLRERPLDIVAITERVLTEHDGASLSPGVAEVLRRYAWPGNVRELRHAVEHALALGDGRMVRAEDLPAALRTASVPPPALAVEREAPLQRSIDDAERRAIVARPRRQRVEPDARRPRPRRHAPHTHLPHGAPRAEGPPGERLRGLSA